MHDYHGDFGDTALFGGIVKKIGRAAKSVGRAAGRSVRAVASVPKAAVKAASSVPIVGKGLAGTVQLVTAPVSLVHSIASGERIDKAVLGNLKQSLQSIRDVAPYAQTVVSLVPGVGPGVSGAMAAAVALSEGKTLNQALIEGIKNAVPGGPAARAAFAFAEAMASGKSVTQSALASLPLNATQRKALNLAINATRSISQGKPVTMALADAAMKELPADIRTGVQLGLAVAQGENLQRAAGKAANTMTRKVLSTGMGMSRRPGDVINVLPPPARRNPLKLVHSSLDMVNRTLKNNPTLRALDSSTLARRMNVRPSMVNQALGMNRGSMLGFRGLSGNAAQTIRRLVPFAAMKPLLEDTRGLIDGGKVYVVESGDFPGKIASKLTGKAGNWPQLIRANPKKATVDKGIGPEFKTLYAGEKLLVPASWQQSGPATTVNPPSVADTAAVLQAKSILAAWGKTDGLSSAGVSDYGSRTEDLSTAWGARDKLMLTSFSKWSNITRKTNLSATGELTASHGAALRAWAEERATVPAAIPQPTATTPSASPAPTAIPVLTLPTGGGTVPVLSTPSPSAQAPTQGSAAPKSAGDSGGSLLPILAGSAAGYGIGGPLGALIGAGAGLLLTSGEKK